METEEIHVVHQPLPHCSKKVEKCSTVLHVALQQIGDRTNLYLHLYGIALLAVEVLYLKYFHVCAIYSYLKLVV